MAAISFASNKYVIVHGAPSMSPSLIIYAPPAKLWPGQPEVEDFDDAQDAVDRAIALDVPPLYTHKFWPHGQALNHDTHQLVDHGPIVPWSEEGNYPVAAVVTHNDQHWLHISDVQGEPDDVYDVTAGTGDWVPFHVKPEPTPPPEPTAEQKQIAQLEARLAALEASAQSDVKRTTVTVTRKK